MKERNTNMIFDITIVYKVESRFIGVSVFEVNLVLQLKFNIFEHKN